MNTMNAEQLKDLMEDYRYMGKTITLSDGRILSYSESGNVDSGSPVLFQMGLMSSSLGVVLLHHEALRLNLHIIAIDYPGVGDSTNQPDRTLRHWPIDFFEFTNQVLGETTTFSLLAHSMGGPHALAVMADARAKSRIIRATIVSPWLPFPDDDEHAPRFLKVARRMPAFLQESIIPTVATTLTTSTLSMAGSMAGSIGSTSSSSAAGAAGRRGQDGNLNMFAAQRIVDYSRKQGQEGNREMVRIAIGEHLVLPESVSYPVVVFCGTKDHLVSEASCRKLITSIDDGWDYGVLPGGVSYTSVKGADHNSVMGGQNLSAVLATLQDENYEAPEHGHGGSRPLKKGAAGVAIQF